MIGESFPRRNCPNCGALSEMASRDRMFDGRYRCRHCGTIFDPFLVLKDEIVLVQSDDPLLGAIELKSPPETPSESACPYCRSAARLDKSTKMLDGRYMCLSCGCAFEEDAALPMGFAHEDLPRPSWAMPIEIDEDRLSIQSCFVYSFVALVVLALYLVLLAL